MSVPNKEGARQHESTAQSPSLLAEGGRAGTAVTVSPPGLKIENCQLATRANRVVEMFAVTANGGLAPTKTGNPVPAPHRAGFRVETLIQPLILAVNFFHR